MAHCRRTDQKVSSPSSLSAPTARTRSPSLSNTQSASLDAALVTSIFATCKAGRLGVGWKMSESDSGGKKSQRREHRPFDALHSMQKKQSQHQPSRDLGVNCGR